MLHELYKCDGVACIVFLLLLNLSLSDVCMRLSWTYCLHTASILIVIIGGVKVKLF